MLERHLMKWCLCTVWHYRAVFNFSTLSVNSARGKSYLKGRGLWALFVTSQISWKPVLTQCSSYAGWCGNLQFLMHKHWKRTAGKWITTIFKFFLFLSWHTACYLGAPLAIVKVKESQIAGYQAERCCLMEIIKESVHVVSACYSFHIQLPCWQTAVNIIMYLLWSRFDMPAPPSPLFLSVPPPHPVCQLLYFFLVQAWELGREWANTPVWLNGGKEGW